MWKQVNRFLAVITSYSIHYTKLYEDDIYEGRESSSVITPNSSTLPTKLTALPTQTIYYDESDGKLHIGNVEISIPKEIEPPQDIAPEEEIYVRELLGAYAEAIGSGEITKNRNNFV